MVGIRLNLLSPCTFESKAAYLDIHGALTEVDNLLCCRFVGLGRALFWYERYHLCLVTYDLFDEVAQRFDADGDYCLVFLYASATTEGEGRDEEK